MAEAISVRTLVLDGNNAVALRMYELDQAFEPVIPPVTLTLP
jgi:hypothetical protein